MHEIEADLIKQIVGVPVDFDEPKNVGTPGNLVLEIEGRIGEEDEGDLPHCSFGFIYVIGLLSFLDAHPAAPQMPADPPRASRPGSQHP